MRSSRLVYVPSETVRDLTLERPEFRRYLIGQFSERVWELTGTVEADRITEPITRLVRVILRCSIPS